MLLVNSLLLWLTRLLGGGLLWSTTTRLPALLALVLALLSLSSRLT